MNLPLSWQHMLIVNLGLRLLSGLNRFIQLCMHDCVLPRGGCEIGQLPIFIQREPLIDTHISVLHRGPSFGVQTQRFSGLSVGSMLIFVQCENICPLVVEPGTVRRSKLY